MITLKHRQHALFAFDAQLNQKPVKFLKERCAGGGLLVDLKISLIAATSHCLSFESTKANTRAHAQKHIHYHLSTPTQKSETRLTAGVLKQD